MPKKEIVRSVKLRSGKICEVRSQKLGPTYFVARSDHWRAIRVHASIHGWSAHNGIGTIYHHANAAEAFAIAANNLWN